MALLILSILVASTVAAPASQLGQNTPASQLGPLSHLSKRANIPGATNNITWAFLNQRCGAAYNAYAWNSYAMNGTGNALLSGLCCSQWNYAGFTDDHCLLSNGCQTSWGRCIDDKAAPPSPAVYNACTTLKTFAITFDDGPSVLTSSLLDYLKSVGLKVTFFINGINWKAAPTKNPLPGLYNLSSVVQRAYSEGHQICSHTWSHTDLITVNHYNVTYEMTRLNRAFKQILGVIPTCMRPPYGDYDAPSLRVLQNMGYGADQGGAIVTWNDDPADWDPLSYSTDPATAINDMLKEFQNEMKSFGGSKFISLDHDTWNTTADFRTAAAGGTLVPKNIKPLAQRIYEYLKGAGYSMVRLDQCLGRPVGSMYRTPNANDDVCGDVGTCFT